MAKKWEVRTIQRSSPTAEAQLARAEASGFERFETNAKHHKLRRPWAEAARADAGLEEHPEEEHPEEEEPEPDTQ